MSLILFLAAGFVQAQNATPADPGKANADSTLAGLLKAVETRDGPDAAAIRTNAAATLSRQGDAKVLIPLLTNNFDPQVRLLAAQGMAGNADDSVTAALLEALRDTNAQVRLAAITGLNSPDRNDIPASVPAFLKCLDDHDPDVRLQAANLLCLDPAAARELIPALKLEQRNPDSVVRAAAAVALKEWPKDRYPAQAFQTFAQELAISLAEQQGVAWSAAVKVLDERRQPVPGAAVSIIYYVPAKLGGDPAASFRKIEGLTGANGVFVGSHRDNTLRLAFEAQKDGYYRTRAGRDFTDETNRNFALTLVVKKMIHPVPMYANRVDFVHGKKLPLDQPIGFDLLAGDWVAPIGKGIQTQMLVTWSWHVDKDDRRGYEEKLSLSFPNAGDGIKEFDSSGPSGSGGSDLRSPQEAPQDGYQPQLIKLRSSHPGQPGTNTYDSVHKNYFLRVQTSLDENGKVKSALYGKIYGDFDEAFWTFLNPETNSRSLELDPKHNLGRGGFHAWPLY
ncbi:MAG TPA: HEAT repeat domain-containing protein [Verrucomicrobiae bacterium]|nr:HEAT repeat domain-containing protein [Verrucomicrobiae bacterium]